MADLGVARLILEEKITRKKRFRQRIKGSHVEQMKRQTVWRKGKALRSADQGVEALEFFYR